jgi:hypothetical protein
MPGFYEMANICKSFSIKYEMNVNCKAGSIVLYENVNLSDSSREYLLSGKNLYGYFLTIFGYLGKEMEIRGLGALEYRLVDSFICHVTLPKVSSAKKWKFRLPASFRIIWWTSFLRILKSRILREGKPESFSISYELFYG